MQNAAFVAFTWIKRTQIVSGSAGGASDSSLSNLLHFTPQMLNRMQWELHVF